MAGTSLLIWGMIFGVIGLAYFTYGKKQQAIVPLLVGIALFVVPYLISNVYILVLVGAILVIIPYFLRL